MDNFNFKQYLSENRIHADHDLIKEKKEDSKKGNKEEQKRMEGAIRDNEIHIDKLNRDKKADKKKLAKLKADEPKDVSEVQGYVDRENESDAERLGSDTDSAGVGSKRHKEKDERDLSYGKFGKRDAEKKGKNKVNKEEVEIDESAIAVAAGVASIFGGAVAADKAMDALEAGKLGEKGKSFAKFLRQAGSAAGSRYDEGQVNEKQDSKKGNESEQKRMEGAIKDDRDHIKDLKKDIEDNERKLARLKKDYKKDVIKEEEKDVEEGYGKPMYDEDDTDATNEEMSTKMKVSDLKKKIKEDILAELALNEADEVDVDIDVEDEVEVEAGADDIEIERKGVKARVEVGLSPEEEIIQDSLKAAMDSANALGNDKLADQIGNTITFFTREYVVGDRS